MARTLELKYEYPSLALQNLGGAGCSKASIFNPRTGEFLEAYGLTNLGYTVSNRHPISNKEEGEDCSVGYM